MNLHLVRDNFRHAYEASMHAHGSQDFIKVYRTHGITQKTYKEFHRDVLGALSQLRAKLPADAVLATSAGNTYPHLVYITAGILGGWSFCPINPGESEERIQKKLAVLPQPALLFREADMNLAEGSADPVDFPLSKPMALIFTSGTSGESKICELMESNILANANAVMEHHQLREGRVIATSLPVYHVNALMFSFLSSLLSGSRLILFERFHIPTLRQALVEDSVEILSLMPVLLRLMVNRAQDFSPEDWKSVRYVVSAAAPLSCTLAEDFLKCFNRFIMQGYGLSEAVNFSATLPIDLSPLEYKRWMLDGAHPSIGVALQGNDIQIIDNEICIRGTSVMRSYLGVDSRELFKDGFLHTGDLGYSVDDEQGRRFFFVSGRKKDVIKRFGETISLREVDDMFQPILCAQSDLISVGFENDLAGEELAMIFRSEGGDVAAERVTEHLSRVPKMYWPRVVISTQRPLRTPSGKPQRWRFRELFDDLREKQFTSKIEFRSELP